MVGLASVTTGESVTFCWFWGSPEGLGTSDGSEVTGGSGVTDVTGGSDGSDGT